jgi:hypothetical protein
MAVALSTEAFKRIAAATKRVEKMPMNLTGDRSGSHASPAGFWAMILGCDVGGLRWTFNKVTFDPKSVMPEAFTLNSTHRFAFDGDGFYEAGIEANGNRDIGFGTIVWMTFAGYDTNDNPVFLFSHQTPDLNQPLRPHDHRDNNNGGFAFATFHPGTSLPSMPWAL